MTVAFKDGADMSPREAVLYDGPMVKTTSAAEALGAQVDSILAPCDHVTAHRVDGMAIGCMLCVKARFFAAFKPVPLSVQVIVKDMKRDLDDAREKAAGRLALLHDRDKAILALQTALQNVLSGRYKGQARRILMQTLARSAAK